MHHLLSKNLETHSQTRLFHLQAFLHVKNGEGINVLYSEEIIRHY